MTKKSSHKKNGSESVTADTDITCTLACVTQKQESNSNCREELEVLDEFLAESLKEEEEHVKAGDRCRLEERLAKDYCIYSDKENDNFFENCDLSPSVVGDRISKPLQVKDSQKTADKPINRDEQYPHTPLRDKVLSLSKAYDESRLETVGRSYFTSTQDSKSNVLSDRRLSSLSLSTIHSEGGTPKKDHVADVDLSSVGPSESTFSTSSDTPSIKDSHAEGRKGVSSEEFDDCMDFAPVKDQDRHTQVSLRKDPSSQLHTTVMGDDGIPVFQIQPIEVNDVSEECSSELIQPLQNADKDNISDKEVQNDHAKSLESASTSNTEVQEKQTSLTTEREKNSLAGSWSRGHVALGNNIQVSLKIFVFQSLLQNCAL